MIKEYSQKDNFIVKAFQFSSSFDEAIKDAETLTGGHAKCFGVDFGIIVSYYLDAPIVKTLYPGEWLVKDDSGKIMVYKGVRFNYFFEEFF
jgi:hypothetical protein